MLQNCFLHSAVAKLLSFFGEAARSFFVVVCFVFILQASHAAGNKALSNVHTAFHSCYMSAVSRVSTLLLYIFSLGLKLWMGYWVWCYYFQITNSCLYEERQLIKQPAEISKSLASSENSIQMIHFNIFCVFLFFMKT